jgi:hypothetical protein
MIWNARYLPDEKLIDIVCAGILSYEDYENNIKNAIALAAKHQAHLFLCDHARVMNLAQVFQIYDLPFLFDKLGLERKSKIAIITPDDPSSVGVYNLFEKACLHLKWSVKLFTRREAAMKWLKHPDLLQHALKNLNHKVSPDISIS